MPDILNTKQIKDQLYEFKKEFNTLLKKYSALLYNLDYTSSWDQGILDEFTDMLVETTAEVQEDYDSEGD